MRPFALTLTACPDCCLLLTRPPLGIPSQSNDEGAVPQVKYNFVELASLDQMEKDQTCGASLNPASSRLARR